MCSYIILDLSGQLHVPAAFTSKEKASGIHWIWGWVRPGDSLDAVSWEKISCLCWESNIGCAGRRPLLYRLNSLGSLLVKTRWTNIQRPFCTWQMSSRITNSKIHSVDDWGSMLQAGMSRVRFWMMSMDFLYWPYLSSRTIVVGSIQSVTEMSTRDLPGDKGRLACKADNLTVICEPIV
jgi:hypothetical protein